MDGSSRGKLVSSLSRRDPQRSDPLLEDGQSREECDEGKHDAACLAFSYYPIARTLLR